MAKIYPIEEVRGRQRNRAFDSELNFLKVIPLLKAGIFRFPLLSSEEPLTGCSGQ